MLKPSVTSSSIKKINAGVITDSDDLLAAEEPLEIRLGFGAEKERQQKSISVTMRTPGNDFELSLGFLYTEGIIKSHNDVSQIRYCTELNQIENKENIVRVELKEHVQIDIGKLQRNFYTTSSCGICGKASIDAIKVDSWLPEVQVSDIKADASLIYSLPVLLRKQQSVFEYTGGLHASALFDAAGKLLFIREDIGRHNALDKLIGAALAKNLIPLQQHILLLSGRASFELLQKAAMAGIRIVAAIGAPSSLAAETAREFDITLIGFLRENRFNIYSSPERITF